MAYRIAICGDSVKDAEFVQGILNHRADQRKIRIWAEVFSSTGRFLLQYAEDKASHHKIDCFRLALGG